MAGACMAWAEALLHVSKRWSNRSSRVHVPLQLEHFGRLGLCQDQEREGAPLTYNGDKSSFIELWHASTTLQRDRRPHTPLCSRAGLLARVRLMRWDKTS
jgi:hypothetical protein